MLTLKVTLDEKPEEEVFFSVYPNMNDQTSNCEDILLILGHREHRREEEIGDNRCLRAFALNPSGNSFPTQEKKTSIYPLKTRTHSCTQADVCTDEACLPLKGHQPPEDCCAVISAAV